MEDGLKFVSLWPRYPKNRYCAISNAHIVKFKKDQKQNPDNSECY